MGETDNNEYVTDEEMLPLDQSRVTEHANFTCSTLGKAFEKQIKTLENPGEKHVKAIEEHGKQLAKSNTFIE